MESIQANVTGIPTDPSSMSRSNVQTIGGQGRSAKEVAREYMNAPRNGPGLDDEVGIVSGEGGNYRSTDTDDDINKLPQPAAMVYGDKCVLIDTQEASKPSKPKGLRKEQYDDIQDWKEEEEEVISETNKKEVTTQESVSVTQTVVESDTLDLMSEMPESDLKITEVVDTPKLDLVPKTRPVKVRTTRKARVGTTPPKVIKEVVEKVIYKERPKPVLKSVRFKGSFGTVTAGYLDVIIDGFQLVLVADMQNDFSYSPPDNEEPIEVIVEDKVYTCLSLGINFNLPAQNQNITVLMIPSDTKE